MKAARDIVSEIQALFDQKDFSALRTLLAHFDKAALAREWPRFVPIRKAALFKLLPPAIAMELFKGLPWPEKYFLLTAFDLGSIAPILEDAPAKTKALFYRLPEECYEVMIQELAL